MVVQLKEQRRQKLSNNRLLKEKDINEWLIKLVEPQQQASAGLARLINRRVSPRTSLDRFLERAKR